MALTVQTLNVVHLLLNSSYYITQETEAAIKRNTGRKETSIDKCFAKGFSVGFHEQKIIPV